MPLRRWAAVAAVVYLAASAAAPTPALARTEEQPYVGGPGDTSTVCVGSMPGVGGACFAVMAGETVVTITVRDDVVSRPGAEYQFDADAGHFFCGATTVTVPPGARTLYVSVLDAFAVIACPEHGLPATHGTISAEFS